MIQSESLAIFITPLSLFCSTTKYSFHVDESSRIFKGFLCIFPSLDIVKGNYLNALVAD